MFEQEDSEFMDPALSQHQVYLLILWEQGVSAHMGDHVLRTLWKSGLELAVIS